MLPISQCKIPTLLRERPNIWIAHPHPIFLWSVIPRLLYQFCHFGNANWDQFVLAPRGAYHLITTRVHTLKHADVKSCSAHDGGWEGEAQAKRWVRGRREQQAARLTIQVCTCAADVSLRHTTSDVNAHVIESDWGQVDDTCCVCLLMPLYLPPAEAAPVAWR